MVRIHVFSFRTICTKFQWLHDTFHGDAFCSFPWKTLSPFASFYCLSKHLKRLFFLLKSVQLTFYNTSEDAHLHNLKWKFFHLKSKHFLFSAADTSCFESKMMVYDVCLWNNKFHYLYLWANTKFQKIRKYKFEIVRKLTSKLTFLYQLFLMTASGYSSIALRAEGITSIRTDGNPLWMMILCTVKKKKTTSMRRMYLW